MRPIVQKAWSDAIDEKVLALFPDFVRVEGRGSAEPKGLRKFQWRPSEALTCFIAFRPLDDEAFDAFVAWSTRGKFPTGPAQTEAKADGILDFSLPEVLAWSMALVPRSGVSYWSFWDPPSSLANDPAKFGAAFAEHYSRALSYDEARILVEPKVCAGIAEVHDFGLPYLLRRVQFELERS